MRRPLSGFQMARQDGPCAEPEGITGSKQDGRHSPAGEQRRNPFLERGWPAEGFGSKGWQQRKMARRSGNERGLVQRGAGGG